MDEFYEIIISDVGEPHDCQPVTDETLQRYRGRLPNKLLQYWQYGGFCGFGDGLFWITNPEDYDGVLEKWLGGTALWQPDDNPYHVIARTAFGDLYLWGERSGGNVTINPALYTIHLSKPKDEEEMQSDSDRDRSLQVMLTVRSRDDVDSEDENEELMFQRALEKFGPLKADQYYGLKQAYILGGKRNLENHDIMDLLVHLDILRGLGEPLIIDLDATFAR